MCNAKKQIIQRFISNVYGRKPDVSDINSNHDGKYGHWLETQMGIIHNGDNAPDLFGYEMKNDTTSGKTTFGDWSPNKALYKDGSMSRAQFLQIFGHHSKPHRWSWSGTAAPKIRQWNSFGQQMRISSSSSIQVIYDYKYDQRIDKSSIVPEKYRNGENVIAEWTSDYIKERVENKFNNLGWFKCKLENGVYKTIVFGEPFDIKQWLFGVESGSIYLDCGMYYDELKDNARPYMNWRADNSYWDSLITEKYPE